MHCVRTLPGWIPVKRRIGSGGICMSVCVCVCVVGVRVGGMGGSGGHSTWVVLCQGCGWLRWVATVCAMVGGNGVCMCVYTNHDDIHSNNHLKMCRTSWWNMP